MAVIETPFGSSPIQPLSIYPLTGDSAVSHYKNGPDEIFSLSLVKGLVLFSLR